MSGIPDLLAPAGRPSRLDVLAPQVAEAAVAADRRRDPVVRIASVVLVLLLTAGFLYVTVSSALIALADPTAGEDPGSSGDAVQIAFYLAVLAAAGLTLLACSGVAGRAASGFPRGSGPWLGRLLVGSLATVYVPLVVCTTVYVGIAAAGDAPQPNSPRQSTLLGLTASLSSGIAEEVFVVVVPVVLLGPLVGRVVRRSARAGRAAVALLVVVMVAARLSYHLYYGRVVVVLVPWALLTVLVYLRTRAVLPLMICHVAYDGLLQLPGFLGVLATVALALYGLVAGLRRAHTVRSDSPAVR